MSSSPEKTEHAMVLVRKFPDHAVPFLVAQAPDAALKQAAESLCHQHRMSIHAVLSELRQTGLSMSPLPGLNNAPMSPPSSLGSPGIFPSTSRSPTRTSDPMLGSERVTALVSRKGIHEEYSVTMKRSSMPGTSSFIREDVVATIGACGTPCEMPVTLPYGRAPGNVWRAEFQYQLTWQRSHSKRTHRTACLIVPCDYLETDVELGHDDYGNLAEENYVYHKFPIGHDEANIHTPNPLRNFYAAPYEGDSFHRSVLSDHTVVPAAANPSFNHGHGQGQGQAHGSGPGHGYGQAFHLADDLTKRQANRQGSSSPSQFLRQSPSRNTGSPTSNQSQARVQTTPVPSTSSKLGQSTQSLASIRVEYLWGLEGDVSTSGPLNLNASGTEFLSSLQQKFHSLGQIFSLDLHCVRFIPEIDKPKFRHWGLDDTASIDDDWERILDWIHRNKSSKKPPLFVVAMEKPDG